MKKLFILLITLLIITGCAATGKQFRSDVYRSNQVNQVQEGKVITITKIMPAKIEVDNTRQKKQARLAGGVIGALAGGLGVGLGTKSTGGAVAGGVGGGALGGLAGDAIAKDKVLVDGVTISYFNAETGKHFSSTQVGRLCEYKEGAAYVVITQYGETRIQPNTTCQEEQ